MFKVLERFGELQDKLATAEAEVERLKGSSEVQRAGLIKPYAWAVLWFVVAYGAVAAILLLLQGFHPLGFHIHDGVMSVIVGSTAVAAIGLVNTVVKGLFPSISP